MPVAQQGLSAASQTQGFRHRLRYSPAVLIITSTRSVVLYDASLPQELMGLLNVGSEPASPVRKF